MRKLTFVAMTFVMALVVVLLAACAQVASLSPEAFAQSATPGVQGGAGAPTGRGRANPGSASAAQGGAGVQAGAGQQNGQGRTNPGSAPAAPGGAGAQGGAGQQGGQGRNSQGSAPAAQGGAGRSTAPGAQGGRPQGAAGGGRAVPVTVAKAATGMISQTLSYASTIQSKDAVKITPLVSGRIDSIKVAVGDVLKAGDVIAQIEPTNFQAQVDQAQANYTAAQQKLVRMQIGSRPEEIAAAQAAVNAAQAALNAVNSPTSDQITVAAANMAKAEAALKQAQADYDKVAGAPNIGASSQALALQNATITYQSAVAAYNLAIKPTGGQLAPLQNALAQAQLKLVQTKQPYLDSDVAQVQATVDQTKAALDAAKAQLANATIRAPFDGVVAEVYISKGTSAGPSAPVVLFVSSGNVVALDAEESKISQIKNDLDASVRVSAYPGREFPAKVTSVAPVADTRTHSFSVVVTPVDDAGLLRPGMYADVVIVATLKPDALLVPVAAVTQLGNQSIVYVVKSDNTVEVRPVTMGLSDPNHIEIVAGLQAGERVVTAGLSTLVNGASVNVTGGG
jgi:HlyD family secretion protein